MRALQLDPVTLSEVRRQRARAIFGRMDGRFASVDREPNPFRCPSEGDLHAVGPSAARNNDSTTSSSKYTVTSAVNSKPSAILKSAMKPKLAQVASGDFAGASVTDDRIHDYVDSRIHDYVLAFEAAKRPVASAAGDSSAAAKSDAPAEHPGLASESGPSQHLPGSFPGVDTTRELFATVGGLRDPCGAHEGRQTRDACCRLCNHVSRVVHYGVVCDACKTTIRGHRFKCVKCADYDLCNACKLMGHHSRHNFECISFPIPAVIEADISADSDFCENQVAEEERHQCTEQSSAALETALLSQEERLVVHNNVWCDLCHRVITGPRFKCANCDDFDLCSECEMKAEHDPDHVFLKIRRPMLVKGVRLLSGPQNVTNTCQQAIQVQPVWTDISKEVDSARVEGSMENSRSFRNKGTETMGLRKCDRATTTDQSIMATSATQTTLSASDDQQTDIQVTTPKSTERATSSAQAQLPDDCVQQNRPNGDFRMVESFVGDDADHVKKSNVLHDAVVSAPTVLIVDVPGGAETEPMLLPDYTTERNVLDSGMGQVPNGRHTAVIDASAPGRDGVISSIVSSDIDDEFVMVSAAEDVSKASVAKLTESEPSNPEVTQKTLTGCRLPSRVPSHLEKADAYTAKSNSRAHASAISTCTKAVAVTSRKYGDAESKQTRSNGGSSLKHSDVVTWD